MTFKPGQSGNPGGRGREKPYRDALRRALARAEVEGKPHSLDRIADAHLAKALSGDVSAVRELADRLDGKVPQAIVGDGEHDPVRIQAIERLITDPKHDDTANPDCTSVPATAGAEPV
jgi:hypothetical protein